MAPGIWGLCEKKIICEPRRRDIGCIQICVRRWTRQRIKGRQDQRNQKINVRGSEGRTETPQVFWKAVEWATFSTSKCSSSSLRVVFGTGFGWMDEQVASLENEREGDCFNYTIDYIGSLPVYIQKICRSLILRQRQPRFWVSSGPWENLYFVSIVLCGDKTVIQQNSALPPLRPTSNEFSGHCHVKKPRSKQSTS